MLSRTKRGSATLVCLQYVFICKLSGLWRRSTWVYRSRAWFDFRLRLPWLALSRAAEGSCDAMCCLFSRLAAPVVPPAVGRIVPEVRGESAVVRAVPEVAEAPNADVRRLAVANPENCRGGSDEGASAPSLRSPPPLSSTPSSGQAQTGGPRSTTSGWPDRSRGSRRKRRSARRPRGRRSAGAS